MSLKAGWPGQLGHVGHLGLLWLGVDPGGPVEAAAQHKDSRHWQDMVLAGAGEVSEGVRAWVRASLELVVVWDQGERLWPQLQRMFGWVLGASAVWAPEP